MKITLVWNAPSDTELKIAKILAVLWGPGEPRQGPAWQGLNTPFSATWEKTESEVKLATLALAADKMATASGQTIMRRARVFPGDAQASARRVRAFLQLVA